MQRWPGRGLVVADGFCALDVETANADRASICQIGIVGVCRDEVVGRWRTFVDPEDWFDPFNTSIHGIDAGAVRGAPTFPEVYEDLCDKLGGRIVVSHTSFDRTAVSRAVARYGLAPLSIHWVDSARIARRAWSDRYGKRGYGLQNIASDLGIRYQPHDALEDARAAAEVVLHACAETGIGIEEWCQRLRRPTKKSRGRRSTGPIRQEGNPDGPLYGEVIVFTGRLEATRREAASDAAGAGCTVHEGVTRQTTILVVGVQDRTRLHGYEKSSKHRKAERLIRQGSDLLILSERDFRDLLIKFD